MHSLQKAKSTTTEGIAKSGRSSVRRSLTFVDVVAENVVNNARDDAHIGQDDERIQHGHARNQPGVLARRHAGAVESLRTMQSAALQLAKVKAGGRFGGALEWAAWKSASGSDSSWELATIQFGSRGSWKC